MDEKDGPNNNCDYQRINYFLVPNARILILGLRDLANSKIPILV